VVEAGPNAEDLVAAFRRLRSHWRSLFGDAPDPPGEPESVALEVREDLSTVTTAARVSEEAVPFVETAMRARLGGLGIDGDRLPKGLSDAAASLRDNFETLISALQQMESGDDILPESGREMRRSAARAAAFFHELRGLAAPDGPSGESRENEAPDAEDRPEEAGAKKEDREAVILRLTRSYDGRRRQVREDMEVQPPAFEAVEFLLRLGAG
jgi:hypothetical protein